MINLFTRFVAKLFPNLKKPESLMYRVHLFDELTSTMTRAQYIPKRILEIGPKDGLDSKRLASLQPDELVMIELPEKRNHISEVFSAIRCEYEYIEENFMYMKNERYQSLGNFDLIWCTGVLYHNAEQMRFLRRLYKLLNTNGYLVLESATLRSPRFLRKGCYVQIHYPQTYRNTGTITHLPTVKAIKAWLRMVGFTEVHDSSCYEKDNRNLVGQRYACICRKTGDDEGDIYYGKTGLNPEYHFGDSS